jgi:hypothetical protein
MAGGRIVLTIDPLQRGMGRPGLQQRGQQQLLGRHRGPSFCGIQLTERGVEPIEGLICQLADPPLRMTRRNPILDRDVGKQGAAAALLASHPGSCSCPIFAGEGGFFSELLSPISSAEGFFEDLDTFSQAIEANVPGY